VTPAVAELILVGRASSWAEVEVEVEGATRIEVEVEVVEGEVERPALQLAP
jgi:hypothetical protein